MMLINVVIWQNSRHLCPVVFNFGNIRSNSSNFPEER